MKIILSGIFSFIGLLLIFIINLSKGKGIIGLLVSPLVGAGIIFGIIFGVLVLLSKMLNVDSILAESVEKETKESSDNVSSIGNNVNFTVSDDVVADEKIDSSASEEPHTAEDAGNDDRLPEINTDKNLDFPDLESDDDLDSAESEGIGNSSEDFNSYTEAFNTKKVTAGMPAEEVIKDKLGVAATPEEIAKGIKTILKRQGDCPEIVKRM